MKKVLRRKLFFTNGCSKNFFLWEIPEDRGVIYEIIEEFRGHHVSRAVLRGLYLQKLKAFSAFRRIINFESAQVPFEQALAMN